MKCSICLDVFDQTVHAPLLGRCGHSVCLFCSTKRQQMNANDCPICKAEQAFDWYKRNPQMNELIGKIDKVVEEQLELEMDIVSDYEKLLAGRTFIKCSQCNCSIEEKQARWCNSSDCSDDLGVGAKSYFYCSRDVILLTVRTQNGLDKMKSKLICASCSIDGPHARHRTMYWFDIQWRSKSFMTAVTLRKEAQLSFQAIHKRFPRLMGQITSIYTLLGRLCFNVPRSLGTIKMEEMMLGIEKEVENIKTLENKVAFKYKEGSAELEEIKMNMESHLSASVISISNLRWSSDEDSDGNVPIPLKRSKRFRREKKKDRGFLGNRNHYTGHIYEEDSD